MPDDAQPVYFERHIARLLIVLYYCGQSSASLLDGATREIDSMAELQRFDFWVREPGHLALALLHAYAAAPDSFDPPQSALLHDSLTRLLADDQIDTRRVTLAGAPYHIFEDFDTYLSFLAARALVSDRPSFSRSRHAVHKVVLESAGADTVKKLLDSCPSMAWYRAQCELVSAFHLLLETVNLELMPYLMPDLTLATATVSALAPYVRQRYAKLFGEPAHVNV